MAKLVAANGYTGLSERSIRETAGASRRSFTENFGEVTDCFVAAVEEQTHEALIELARVQAAAPDWARGIDLAVTALCGQVANDRVFANLCFGEILAAGKEGIACRDRLLADLAMNLRNATPSDKRPDALAVEASLGAIWGILHQCVVTGRAWEAPRNSAAFSYLTLSPLDGARVAVARSTGISIQVRNGEDPACAGHIENERLQKLS